AILHESNPPIIHRDIKPSNIIISNDGILKLIDFDIAREYKMDSDADTAHIGTKKYASPEQYGFSQTDCRSDIFSAGMMMAELLTGEVSEENLNAHGELGKIISKCIEVDPKQRFQNVKEVRKALANKPSNKSRKIIGFIAAGIIAACVVIAMLFAISRPNNETQNLNGGMQNLNSETQTGGEESDFIEAPDFLTPTQGIADELSNELPDFNSVGLELESFYNIVIQHPTINRELREILGDMYDFFMENMTRSMVRNNAIGGVFPDELDGKRVLHMFSTPQNPSVVFSSVIVSENGNIYVWLTIDKRHYHFTNDANRIYRIPYEFPAYSQIFLGENVFANASGNTNLQQGENIFYKGYNTITITLDGNEAHFELVTISPWVDETAVFSGEFTLDSNYVFFTNYRHRVPAERITAHFNFIEGYLYFGGFAQLFNRRNFEPLDGIYRLR
ncbi:MAG: protein kinase, partial [Defluviitaleaceae bacterium]|nr:protein kinase [Defluviitaleaceae bacterium]